MMNEKIEPVAWQCTESGSILRINKAHGSYTIPLYTHPAPADTGEVERLRERCAALDMDLAGLTKANDVLINQRGEAWIERDRLRAQRETSNDARETLSAQLRASHANLAKAHVLLRELVECEDLTFWPSAVERDHPNGLDLEDWFQRARLYLSTSGEHK